MIWFGKVWFGLVWFSLAWLGIEFISVNIITADHHLVHCDWAWGDLWPQGPCGLKAPGVWWLLVPLALFSAACNISRVCGHQLLQGWFGSLDLHTSFYQCLPFSQLLVSGPKPVVSNIVSLQFLKLLVVIISKFCVQSYFLSIIVRQDLLQNNTQLSPAKF